MMGDFLECSSILKMSGTFAFLTKLYSEPLLSKINLTGRKKK